MMMETKSITLILYNEWVLFVAMAQEVLQLEEELAHGMAVWQNGSMIQLGIKLEELESTCRLSKEYKI
jgi:hypothetical protein